MAPAFLFARGAARRAGKTAISKKREVTGPGYPRLVGGTCIIPSFASARQHPLVRSKRAENVGTLKELECAFVLQGSPQFF